MGQINTEQATRLIETTAEAIANTQPEPEPTNYWWLLAIAVIPVLLGVWWKGKK